MSQPNIVIIKILQNLFNCHIRLLLPTIKKFNQISKKWNKEILPKLQVQFKYKDLSVYDCSGVLYLCRKYNIGHKVNGVSMAFDMKTFDEYEDDVQSLEVTNSQALLFGAYPNLKKIRVFSSWLDTFDEDAIDELIQYDVSLEVGSSKRNYLEKWDSWRLFTSLTLYNQNLELSPEPIESPPITIRLRKLKLCETNISSDSNLIELLLTHSPLLEILEFNNSNIPIKQVVESLTHQNLPNLKKFKLENYQEMEFTDILRLLNSIHCTDVKLKLGDLEAESPQNVFNSTINNQSIKKFYFQPIRFTQHNTELSFFNIWKDKSQLEFITITENKGYILKNTDILPNLKTLKFKPERHSRDYFIYFKELKQLIETTCPNIIKFMSNHFYCADLILLLKENYPKLREITVYGIIENNYSITDLITAIKFNTHLKKLLTPAINIPNETYNSYPILCEILKQNHTLETVLLPFDYTYETNIEKELDDTLSHNTTIKQVIQCSRPQIEPPIRNLINKYLIEWY
ncbi:hypothetical protein DLAC_03652 [Tieghemostelium lacteum]|uniref:F-box domain-containing protein n=1 Tax=Tieghemostelium lacteum TaxID=361077 RepID=A0A152A0D0_TIELA|nr:hypothetical protein DLAC_03652 [Tieghemostelium lacteum]|eukprot:KYQ99712.1 hypothetical protein DLAC_03652 [Tieghemostelium lacteum]